MDEISIWSIGFVIGWTCYYLYFKGVIEPDFDKQFNEYKEEIIELFKK